MRQFQKDRGELAKHTVSVTGYYHKVAIHLRFQDIALSYMRTTFILYGFLVGCDLVSLGLTATSSGNTLGYLSPGRFLKHSGVISMCTIGISSSVVSTADIVARSVRQFQKDRDEQAKHTVLVTGTTMRLPFI